MMNLDRFDRKDIHDPDSGDLYLQRWTLWRAFGWKLMVHRIVRPDYSRCQHDHPWWFIAVMLKGGYTEIAGNLTLKHEPGDFLYRRATFRHAITDLTEGEAWTLILRGRYVRDWGFWNGAFTKWVKHTIYDTAWCGRKAEG